MSFFSDRDPDCSGNFKRVAASQGGQQGGRAGPRASCGILSCQADLLTLPGSATRDWNMGIRGSRCDCFPG
jgi:hypothetical protein